jgi:lipopolysaccharide export system protein LptA
MRTLLTFLLIATVAWFGLSAEKPAAKPAVGTNNLIVFADGGVDLFLPAKVVYRKNVQVFESDMYMECDLLTMLRLTNSPARPAGGGLTNMNAEIDTITAEKNFLMMARGTTVVGDRAVYTKSNETVVVTGDLVVIQTDKIMFFATNFAFNRLTSEGHAVGWTATEVEVSDGLRGTNAPKAGFGPIRNTRPAPAQPTNGAAK